MAPIWPPVAPLLMAGAGNWEQSKLDGPSVEPVSELASLYFEGFCVENFSSSSLFVCLILPVPQHASRQLPPSGRANAAPLHAALQISTMHCRVSPYRVHTPHLGTNTSLRLNKRKEKHVCGCFLKQHIFLIYAGRPHVFYLKNSGIMVKIKRSSLSKSHNLLTLIL